MGKAEAPDWRLKVERGKVNGKPRFLWSAVNGAGEVLDIYTTEAHDEAAALRFFEKSLKNPWASLKIRSVTSIPRRK